MRQALLDSHYRDRSNVLLCLWAASQKQTMNTYANRIGIRWTVGDVSRSGFEAPSLSIRSAWNLFPEGTRFAVCVNTISTETARLRTGEVPSSVQWVDANSLVPEWLYEHVDTEMAEGVAWKFAPFRLFPDCYEIALDNDVILWRIPELMQVWVTSGDSNSTIMAEDLQRSLGQFSALCDSRAVNSGIRGIPPRFNYELRLRTMLQQTRVSLQSELDEQGLQAAVFGQTNLTLVSTGDVTICSAFPMHQHYLGRCGAHFVGLNRKTLPWKSADGRPIHELIREAWNIHSQTISEMVGTQEEVFNIDRMSLSDGGVSLPATNV